MTYTRECVNIVDGVYTDGKLNEIVYDTILKGYDRKMFWDGIVVSDFGVFHCLSRALNGSLILQTSLLRDCMCQMGVLNGIPVGIFTPNNNLFNLKFEGIIMVFVGHIWDEPHYIPPKIRFKIV